MDNIDKNKGFTLLELAVSLLAIIILYGVLSVRLGNVAESTERAAVYAMLGQIEHQMNLRVASFYINGTTDKVASIVQENPFIWSEPTAKLYAGEIVLNVGQTLIDGRWYYDPYLKHLVYRVQRNKHLKIQGGEKKSLRFMLKLKDTAADKQVKSAMSNLSIEAVTPFVWDIEA